MKEYKAPATRIKVVKSGVKTEYWPQRKNWLGFWETYDTLNRYRVQVYVNKDCKEGSLEFAKAVIDQHHIVHKEIYEEELISDKHKKEQKITYFKYP